MKAPFDQTPVGLRAILYPLSPPEHGTRPGVQTRSTRQYDRPDSADIKRGQAMGRLGPCSGSRYWERLAGATTGRIPPTGPTCKKAAGTISRGPQEIDGH